MSPHLSLKLLIDWLVAHSSPSLMFDGDIIIFESEKEMNGKQPF
jgi:hypothetical protein